MRRRSRNPPAPQNDVHEHELTPQRILVRLSVEAGLIAYFVAVKWAIKWCLHSAGMEREWWAQYLTLLSALQAVVGITVLIVFELFMDLIWVYRSLRRTLKEE